VRTQVVEIWELYEEADLEIGVPQGPLAFFESKAECDQLAPTLKEWPNVRTRKWSALRVTGSDERSSYYLLARPDSVALGAVNSQAGGA
jgi:hypothetical protein